MLACCHALYRQDCTRLCARKLIGASHDCAAMLSVELRTFDNLLWPEAADVPHIHLPRAGCLNMEGLEEVHILQLSDWRLDWTELFM